MIRIVYICISVTIPAICETIGCGLFAIPHPFIKNGNGWGICGKICSEVEHFWKWRLLANESHALSGTG
jgi:hypothetical protein